MSRLALTAIALACAAAPELAAAHAQDGTAEGLVDGLLHPVLGLDHLVAMVAVGLWGAQLGQPLLVALPIAFPLMMTVGALLGLAGVPVPADELGVGLSAVALGLFVYFGWRAPVWAAVSLVAVFAVFHGYAHGVALPEADNPLAYGVGFVAMTGMLHGVGILIGEVAKVVRSGPKVMRGGGATVAAVGAAFALAALAGVR